ncbi:MAG: hypothetical protein II405_07300, partial [Oscillospiraceae bacterium]|nr:hypothetical protein [Oscillospiraceae bacterium]
MIRKQHTSLKGAARRSPFFLSLYGSICRVTGEIYGKVWNCPSSFTKYAIPFHAILTKIIVSLIIY